MHPGFATSSDTSTGRGAARGSRQPALRSTWLENADVPDAERCQSPRSRLYFNMLYFSVDDQPESPPATLGYAAKG